MKELWIHAGMPKNGTSALQVFFAKNRESLLGEQLDYIELSDLSAAKNGSITSGNAGMLSRTLLNEKHESYYDDSGDSYNKLIKYISRNNSDRFLLSSEFFSLVQLDKFHDFKTELEKKGCCLKMIYYVRRQDQFLMSGYMQRVKRHGYAGYPDDYARDRYKKNKLLNYFDSAKRFESVLGEGNVVPYIYEATKSHAKGLIGHFLEAVLGQCPSWVVSEKAVNTSPSPLEVKLMLVANQYKPRMRFSDYLVQNSAMAGRSREFNTHNILRPELTREVLAFYHEQNKKFEEGYGQGGVFPEYHEDAYVDLRELQFSADEVMDIITGLLVSFDRRLHRLETK